MQKSFRNTLFLLGLMAVLSAWYFIYEQKIKVEKNATVEKSKQLITLAKEEIQELEIEKKDLKMHFKKTGDQWSFIAPIVDEADSSQLDSMLSSLVSAHEEAVVEESPKDLGPFGLKTPSLTIRVWKNSQEKPHVVTLGEDTPVGNGTYAMLSRSEKLFRISTSLRPAFDKKVEELRNKNIFNITRFDLKEIEIKSKGNQLLLRKGEKDSWSLPAENLPADANEVSKLLNTILDAKATGYGEEKLTLAGEPDARITLSHSNQKTGFILKRVKDKLYLKRDDKKTLFQVDQKVFEETQHKADTYFNKELAAFNRFETKRVKIEKNKDLIELEKGEGPHWTMVNDPKVTVDASKVDQFLTALQDTKFLRTLGARGKGLSTTDLVIRIFEKKDGKESERVVLKLKKVNNAVEGERLDLPVLFELKESDFKNINLGKSDFIKAEEKTTMPNLPPKDEKKS